MNSRTFVVVVVVALLVVGEVEGVVVKVAGRVAELRGRRRVEDLWVISAMRVKWSVRS